MKKRVFSLLLAVAIICGVVPITASAENMTNGQTAVSYTLGASYVINIPASINLNENPNLTITASTMNTNWGQRVSVLIDGASTYENGGNFYLYKDKGTASEAKIKCDLRCSTQVVNGLDYEVARFDDGSTTNSVDPLSLTPESGTPGTYSGTIYFKIQMT